MEVSRRGNDDPSPFERLAAPPRPGPRLRVCFHNAGLRHLDREQIVMVQELVVSYRRETLEPFRTPGVVAPYLGEMPVLEMAEFEGGDRVTVSLASDDGGRMMAKVDRVRTWRSLARSWLRADAGDSDFVELLAASALHADLIVTARPDILGIRARANLERYNVLSPQEAFPVVGVLSRARGQSFLSGPVGMADWYSWILTRGLTPAAWPGFSAFHAGRRVLPDGEELFDLSESVLRRLDHLVTDLDRMMLMWQRRAPRGLARELDNIVLNVCAIQDSLALLAGKYLGVQLKQDHEWSLRNAKWQQLVLVSDASRGGQLVKCLSDAEPYLILAQTLRNQAVHRNLLQTIRTDHDRSERIQLPFTMLRAFKNALDRLGESPGDWGITNERGREVVGVTEFREDGSTEDYEYVSEGAAELDAMPFAIRIVAHVSRLANTIFRILNPISDPRLPDEVRSRSSALPSDPIMAACSRLRIHRSQSSPVHCPALSTVPRD